MSSRYQPLADFLAAQPPETVTVTLTLPEIERLMDGSLPRMALTGTWWGNSRGYLQARAWLDVGWRVSLAQMRQIPRTITFERVSLESKARAGD